MVANQKKIKIQKQICDKENTYAVINLEAMENAMNNLNGEAFKLWCYFAKNQNNYEFELSQKDAAQYGISKSTYYRSLEKLEEQGYLVPIRDGSNIYNFMENGSYTVTATTTKQKYQRPTERSSLYKQMGF